MARLRVAGARCSGYLVTSGAYVSIDRQTRKRSPLFNPRRHKWTKHFRWEGAYLVGRTAVGRVTIALLHINDEYRVELREGLIAEGEFPPG